MIDAHPRTRWLPRIGAGQPSGLVTLNDVIVPVAFVLTQELVVPSGPVVVPLADTPEGENEKVPDELAPPTDLPVVAGPGDQATPPDDPVTRPCATCAGAYAIVLRTPFRQPILTGSLITNRPTPRVRGRIEHVNPPTLMRDTPSQVMSPLACARTIFGLGVSVAVATGATTRIAASTSKGLPTQGMMRVSDPERKQRASTPRHPHAERKTQGRSPVR